MKADYNVFWNVRFDFGATVKRWVVASADRLRANHRAAMRTRKAIVLLEAKIATQGADPSLADRLERRKLNHDLGELESVEHFDLGKYRVLYIPKKGFRITRAKRQRGRNSVCFFDAMPFYATGLDEAAGLDRMARKYLGPDAHKTAEEEGIDVAALGSEEGYYEAHRDAILRYCLRDAELTARLFELILDGFERIGYPFPKQPWSRASVGREMLKSGVEGVVRAGVLEPTRKRYARLARSGHARLWEKAYAGACILMRGVGSWADAWKLDLNSAYPAAMVDFPSLDGAYLVGPSDPRFDRCFFRFYEIELVPTPRRALHANDGDRDHLLYVEGGEPRRVCVTHLDLEAFDAWGDRYRIIDATGVVTPSSDRPLAFMAELYRRKNQIKADVKAAGKNPDESVEYVNSKIPLNGVYGILAQSRPREGRYTNFIYAAYITAFCRRELWIKTKAVEEQGGTVLAQMTDGLFVSGAARPFEASDALGAWDAEYEGLVVLFANGIYYVPKKATPTWDGLKRRGAPDLNIGALMGAAHPWVTTHRSRPLGLKQGIIQGKPEAIGCFADDRKELCPARMLEDTGLRMNPELRAAPLRDFFTRSWFLDYRSPTEPHLPHRILEVAAE